MRRELLELASDLARRGEPFALATVVARTAPVSAQVGDTALVTAEGAFYGWVGGSCTRPTVIAEARAALRDGVARLIALDPEAEAARHPSARVFPMTCHSGGSVEISIQPVLPASRLLVYGASPTARALCRLGKAMGYAVHVLDPTATAEEFSGVDGVWAEPAALSLTRGSAPVFAVIATQGEWDEGALLAALAHEPDYLAVLASRKRFAEMRAALGERVGEARFARIKNPAGLDLGARLPEEIALSVLAEIVQEQRARPAVEPPPAVASAPREARDPVCGMSVSIAGARHSAEHGGQHYYFCCGGCRERFLAEPERYLSARG